MDRSRRIRPFRIQVLAAHERRAHGCSIRVAVPSLLECESVRGSPTRYPRRASAAQFCASSGQSIALATEPSSATPRTNRLSHQHDLPRAGRTRPKSWRRHSAPNTTPPPAASVKSLWKSSVANAWRQRFCASTILISSMVLERS